MIFGYFRRYIITLAFGLLPVKEYVQRATPKIIELLYHRFYRGIKHYYFMHTREFPFKGTFLFQKFSEN